MKENICQSSRRKREREKFSILPFLATDDPPGVFTNFPFLSHVSFVFVCGEAQTMGQLMLLLGGDYHTLVFDYLKNDF